MAGIWCYARPEIGSKHCLKKPIKYANTVVSRQERLSYIKHGSHWSNVYKEYLPDAKQRKGIVTKPQSKHELKVWTNLSQRFRKRIGVVYVKPLLHWE